MKSKQEPITKTKNNKDIIKRVLSIIILTMIILSTFAPLITEIHARGLQGNNDGLGAGDNSKPSKPSNNSNTSQNNTPKEEPKQDDTPKQEPEIEYRCCEDWEYEPNFRTMQVLDVATINNEHTESASDYRPDHVKEYVSELPEFKMADIIEYRGLEKDKLLTPRESSPPLEGYTKFHSTKLKDLIDKNIVNRDTVYNIAKEGISVEPRYNAPIAGAVDLITNYIYKEEDRSHGVYSVQKYEKPKDLMSRTDFITELMKTEELIDAPPIISRSAYRRVDNKNTLQTVDIEEIETSPYQDRMGEMGIDTGQTDVIISHKLFGQMNIVMNNNVNELYLRKAYNKQMFFDNELITQGKDSHFYKKDLTNAQPGVFNALAPRYALPHIPIRSHYAFEYPTGKEWEDDNLSAGQYPKRLTEWKEIINEQKSNPPKYDPTIPFWGTTYEYKSKIPGDETNTIYDTHIAMGIRKGIVNPQWDIFDDWHNDVGMTIVKRRSKTEDPINGYQFFKEENLTIMDAYKYVYQQLLFDEGEKTYTQNEVDYLNATYALEMTSMTTDEQEIVNYLLAKGIIDGDDTQIHKIINLPLTNEVGIDLLWRVVNKEERFKITPELSEVDKKMLDKGYKKAEVEIKTSNAGFKEAWIDNLSEVAKVKNADTNPSTNIRNDFLNENMSVYDFVFIRKPKPTKDDGNVNINLVVNDGYREKMQGYLLADGTGKPYLDGSGYEWIAYIVPKDITKDLMVIGTSDKQAYTFKGLSGEGFYTMPDGKNVGTLAKWSIRDFYNNKAVKSFFGKSDELYNIIDNLIYSRNTASRITSSNDSNEVDKILTEQIKLARKYNNEDKSNPVKTKDPENINMEKLNIVNKVTKNLKLYDTVKGDIKTQEQLIAAIEKVKPLQTEKEEEINISNFKEPKQVELVKASLTDNNWKDVIYLDANEEQTKDILYGPLTQNDMETLEFKGDHLFVKVGDSYEINSDNNGFTPFDKRQLTDGKFKVEKGTRTVNGEQQVVYTMRYPSPSKSYNKELAKFMSNLEMPGDEEGKKKLPGYAKIDGSESSSADVLISKAELAELGIKVISDKILENKRTGQRAFLNTDDNYTLIGNNVTQYKEGDMIVNAFGKIDKDRSVETGDADRVFYNLSVVMELVNDVELASSRMGSVFDVTVSEEKLSRLPMIAPEYRLAGQNKYPVIDYTYLMNKGNHKTDNNYVNLSAITGPASTYIYYKNKALENGVSILLAYKPKSGYRDNFLGDINNTLVGQWGSSGAETTLPARHEGDKLPFSVIGKKGNTKEEIEVRQLKKSIIETIFKGVSNGEDFFQDDYIFNIYALSSPDTDGDTAVNAFLTMIAGQDKERMKTLNKYVGKKPGEGDKNGEIELTINKLDVGKSISENMDFVQHEASGNLYFKMSEGKSSSSSGKQSTIMQGILRQNLYLSADIDKPVLRFRQKRVYQNTPDNHIPLEIYADHKGSFGSMIFTGGAKMYNFGLPTQSPDKPNYLFRYKMPNGGKQNDSTTKRGNNYMIVKGPNVGLFTKIEMPWIELDTKSKQGRKGMSYTNEQSADKKTGIATIKLNEKEGATSSPELMKDLLSIISYELNREVDKTATEIANKPNNAIDGDVKQESTDKYRIDEILKRSKVGYDNTDPKTIASLMSGTWDGILKDSSSTFHMKNKNMDKSHWGDLSKVSDGKTIVVLVTGENSLVKDAITRNNLDIEIKNDAVYAIKMKKGQTVNVKDFKNSKIIQEVTSIRDIEEFRDKAKVYIKPSIGVPHGSTVVGRNGRLKMRKNKLPREEVLYASDIINSLVFRVMLKSKNVNITLLSDVPRGSVVLMDPGDTSRTVVKTSPKQSRTEKLAWVKAVNTVKGESYDKYRIDEMNNFTLLSDFLSNWGSTIMLPFNGNNGTQIPLKAVVGKSVTKITSRDELNKLVNSTDENSNVTKQYSKADLWTRKTSGSSDKGTNSSKNLAMYDVSGTRVTIGVPQRFEPAVISTGATPVTEMVLPPTIAVQKVKKEDTDSATSVDHDYVAVGYYDIRGFAVDKDHSYVEYLRERDTDALNVLDGLEQILRADLKSMRYTDKENNARWDKFWNSALDALKAIAPIITYSTAVMITIGWTLLKLPISRELAVGLAERMNWNKLEQSLTSGSLSPEKMPKPTTLILALVFLTSVGIIFQSEILIDLFGNLWESYKRSNI